MIPLRQFAGKKVAVLGLGRAGEAAVKAAHAGGATVISWDDGEAGRSRAASLPHQIMEPQDWPWGDLAAVIVSPGIPFYFPKPHPAVALARQHQVRLVGEVDLLQQEQPVAKMIGITGTNGKSTTTALIGHLLQQAGYPCEVGGNLGTPALELNEEVQQDRFSLELAPYASQQPYPAGGEHGSKIYVLELSSYQLDLCESLHCHIGILLNISPDHLDRHGSFEGYIQAKASITQHMRQKDLFIIGIDDPHSMQLAKQFRKQDQFPVLAISRDSAKLIAFSEHILIGEGELLLSWQGMHHRFTLTAAPDLQGPHNAQNAAAATAAAIKTGLSPEEIQIGLDSYHGLPHRMERVGDWGTIRFVNDSKATNVDAAIQSLSSYKNIYWIAGGLAKEPSFLGLLPVLPNIHKAYAIGKAEQQLVEDFGNRVPIQACGTLAAAFAKATEDAAQNQEPAVILLAPACASQDQWKNFEERGDAFRKLVQDWIEKREAPVAS